MVWPVEALLRRDIIWVSWMKDVRMSLVVAMSGADDSMGEATEGSSLTRSRPGYAVPLTLPLNQPHLLCSHFALLTRTSRS